MREWLVASALLELDGKLLLVRNVRQGGHEDWTTPGGVIDAEDLSLLEGLSREVEEETGLVVRAWSGPLYEVTAHAPDLGWIMRCEVHRAVAFEGDLRIADPDGIVQEARFCSPDQVHDVIGGCPHWVREPLADWVRAPWVVDVPGAHRRYHYDVAGSRLAELQVGGGRIA